MTDQDKQARLAAALRENLRKRKGQGAPRPADPAKAPPAPGQGADG